MEGFRISPQQKHLWLSPVLSKLTVGLVVSIKGHLDCDLMKATLYKIIERHEILRTNFKSLPGMSYPFQEVQPVEEWWAIHNSSFNFSNFEESNDIEGIFNDLRKTPFDFTNGPLFRVVLLHPAFNSWSVVICASPLCMDQIAVLNLARELNNSYSGIMTDAIFGEELLQYADYAEWQFEMLSSDEAKLAQDKWNKFNPTSSLNNASAGPENAGKEAEFNPELLSSSIEPDLLLKLRTLASNQASSISEVLLSTWQALLWSLTKEPEITSGVYYDGRSYPELEAPLGLFSKYLPVSSYFQANTSFIEILAQISKVNSENTNTQEYFGWEALTNDGGLFEPIFLPFNFEHKIIKLAPVNEQNSEFSIQKIYDCSEQFKVKLNCLEETNTIKLEFHYDADKLSYEELCTLKDRYFILLANVLDSPKAPLASFNILSKKEKEELELFNRTEKSYKTDYLVHQLFEAQAARTPDRVALLYSEQQISYRILNSRSNQLAHYLIELGVGPEVMVGICLPHSVEMIIAVLGVLKAGGAYLPLDPNYPSERLDYLINDSKVEILLTTNEISTAHTFHCNHTKNLDTDWHLIAKYPNKNPEKKPNIINSAYVIYTSGSTGNPKGTIITQAGLLNYLTWATDEYKVADGGFSCPLHSSLAFDLTVTSLFPPILTGQCLIIVDQNDSVESLRNVLRSGLEFSLVKITPSHLNLLKRIVSDRDLKNKIRAFIIGGESLSGKDLKWWQKNYPEIRLINEYGPTETVVGCCIFEIASSDEIKGNVPIGRPIANSEIYLLNEYFHPIPFGFIGEIYIGGAGVSRGYYNRPELTAERFIPNPFSSHPGARLYRTGDLARILPDGNLEFLGRIDNQIKINGYRIELGEIESALTKHPAIKDCVVIARESEDTSSSNKQLVAFLVPNHQSAYTIQRLLELKEKIWPEQWNQGELPNGMWLVYQNKNEVDYLYKEIFEEKSYIKNGIHLQEGATIIDVGANIGVFSLYVGQHVKNASIYAFEPIPPIFNLLSTNVSLYESNIKAFNIGLGISRSISQFTYYPHLTMMSSISGNLAQDKDIVKSYLLNEQKIENGNSYLLDEVLTERLESQLFSCQIKTLSEVIAENNITTIDLLKIDVERSELDVLNGIKKQDWAKIKQIVIEVQDTENCLAKVRSLLEEHGFNIVVEQEKSLYHTNMYVVYARLQFKQDKVVSISGEGFKDTNETIEAWFSPEKLLTSVRNYISNALPYYMLPASYTLLSAVPLTTNGKIDFINLHQRDIAKLNQTLIPIKAYPSTKEEQVLANIWQQILGLPQVGIHDNFFALGGDSILSIQIISRCRQLGLHLTPRQLFQYPTIAQLALLASSTQPVSAEQGLVIGALHLLPIHKWFFEHQFYSNEFGYNLLNQAVVIEFRESISGEVLKKALSQLLLHHDALRLKFIQKESVWQGFNVGRDEVLLEQIHCQVFDTQKDSENPTLAQRVLLNQLKESLDIEKGQLLKGLYIQPDNDAPGVLFLAAHRLVIDQVSWTILLEDLHSLIQQISRSNEINLPSKTTSFKEWISKLENIALTNQLYNRLKDWLFDKFTPAYSLPRDKQGVNSFASARTLTVSLNQTQTQDLLTQVHHAYNTQVIDLLVAGLLQALFKLAGGNTVLVDFEGHGREETILDSDLTRTIGWFTSIYPVLFSIEGELEQGNLLRNVKEKLRWLRDHSFEYGLLRYMSSRTDIEAELKKQPQAELRFNYLGQETLQTNKLSLYNKLAADTEPLPSSESIRSHLIEANAFIGNNSLHLNLTYSSAIHTEATIKMFGDNFISSLQDFITHCKSKKVASFTPSDFPLANIDQSKIDELLLSRSNIEDIYPLTPIQEGILFHTLLSPQSSMYVIQLNIAFKGELDPRALKQAWQRIINRHPVLRTSIVWEELDEPLQLVNAKVDLPWQELNWTMLSEYDQQINLSQFLETDRINSFDLSQPSLMRLTLIHLSKERYQLVWTLHHLLLDGWSMPLILKELATLYPSIRAGKEVNLPIVYFFREYIRWLRDQDMVRAEAFWKKMLKGFRTPVTLCLRQPLKAELTEFKEYGEEQSKLSLTLTNSLQGLAKLHQITLNTIFQGALSILLSRYSGESDVVFGATVSGRPAELIGVESMIGVFINTLPVRTQLQDHQSLLDFLKNIQAQQVELRQFEFSPLVKVQGWSEIPQGVSLFDTILVFENYPVGDSLQSEVIDNKYNLNVLDISSTEKTNYPLTIIVIPGQEIKFRFLYDRKFFDANAIIQIQQHLLTLLERMSNRLTEKISDYSILDNSEQQKLLVDWNQTRENLPENESVINLFEKRVAKAPEAISLVFGEHQISYSELNSKANQLAHYLKKAGLQTEEVVGLCIERSEDMIIAMLAIIKAGGAYLPLDPAYPPERLNYMVKDARVKILLTQTSLLKQWHELTPTTVVICLDAFERLIAQQNKENPNIVVNSKSLIYVIYTSGSTGLPKGVMIEHGNVLNFLYAMSKQIVFEKTGVWLATTSLSFDISVLELIWPLIHGFSVLIGRELASSFLSGQSEKVPDINKGMQFSLFYFASNESATSYDKYQLLLEGAKFADQHHFSAIWTPERHFHSFGGLYPNPSITSAAIATITDSIQIRAGSVVLPLHHPVRIAEEWSMVDNLSGGRVGISFASGWHTTDFVLAPDNYLNRKKIMFEGVEKVRRLWRGDESSFLTGIGTIEGIHIYPKPIQPELPIWITSSGNIESFRMAGELGLNLLTHLLGQNLEELAQKISVYRNAWRNGGFGPGDGHVTLMLHTFISTELPIVRDTIRGPFGNYLKSSLDLTQTMLRSLNDNTHIEELSEEDLETLINHSIDRYYETSGLFGTPQSALKMINLLKSAGVDEVACLIDFGIEQNTVINNLEYLNTLRELSNKNLYKDNSDFSLLEEMIRHGVTHFQTTPSTLQMLQIDASFSKAMQTIKQLLLGGEALPFKLAKQLLESNQMLLNMYGPTETTVWSTLHKMKKQDSTVPIGSPISNTYTYILDKNFQPVPIGAIGELYISGDGVGRGYWDRPDLTAHRFLPNPFSNTPGARMYRTGDLVRYLQNGELEFIGRSDYQVKISGHRIELGEIEEVLRQHPAINECVVVSNNKDDNAKTIVAFFTSEVLSGQYRNDLISFLKGKLPHYMLPLVFVKLDDLPRTPNGKIDRASLIIPAENSISIDQNYVAPSRLLERDLVQIWEELFAITPIGVKDNFFDLGGHSLLATRLISRLRSKFKFAIPLRVVFEYPTIIELAQYIEHSEKEAVNEEPEIVTIRSRNRKKI